MNEKILIQSKSYKWLSGIFILLSLIALIIGCVFLSKYRWTSSYYAPYYGTYLTRVHTSPDMLTVSIICFVVSAIFLLLFLMTFRTKIVVSNTGVSGRAMFGKQVDIPMDSISSVGKHALLKGVSISSSSGVIRFFLLENAEEIFSTVGTLLHDRIKAKTTASNQSAGSSVDDLAKYKALFDAGVISAEEFEAKKKQILGL